MNFGRLLALAFLFTASGVSAQPTGWDPAEWDFEGTDLEPSDGWHFGKLENGMRYIVRQNDRPEGTALVRMLVHAAALDEREDERGFAHYVEHMAFNGSTNVPEGEMVKLLERLGLAFGADTNASTGFDYTQYRLDLPRAEEELLDTALMLMRETASELRFSPEAVERERGVILAERRVRNTYSLQNIVDSLAFAYPEGRVSRRLPIGTIETLEAATADALKAFWQREYVPSSTVLVVVGDFEPETVHARINAHFGSWEAAASPDQPPAGPVDPTMSDLYDIHLHPALDETVSLIRHAPHVDAVDSTAKRQRAMMRVIADRIIDRRLQRLARSEDPPYRSARLSLGNLLETARTSDLTVLTEDGGWEEGLYAAVDEYRRAIQFGFSDAEVAEQVARQLNALENAAAQQGTRSNAALSAAALSLAQGNNVPDDAEQQLARFKAMMPLLTPEAVLGVLKEDWPVIERPIVRFTGKSAPEGGETALREAVNAAFLRPVEAPQAIEEAAFAYTDFGPPGDVVEDRRTQNLDIRQLRFSNGVMLNLKPTDLEADQIRMEITIDGGSLLDTPDNPLSTELTPLLPAGGLGEHSYDELQTILAGRSVGARLSLQPETMTSVVSTKPRDLELQLQLLAAYLVDPGFRAEGLGSWRQGLPAFFARLGKTPASAYGEAAGPILSDGDPRFSRQPIEAYQALDFDTLRAAIGDRLARGAIEIGVVGDFDEDQVIRLVGQTLGALPQRETEFRAYDQGERKRSFTANRRVHTITHEGEADQALLRLVWPTADDSDWERSSRLSLLARVARLMLTETLREELGKTYGAEVGASQSAVWDGYGTFVMGAQIDVNDLEETRAALLATLERLRNAPVEEDLLDRARKPVLESFENRLKSNAGWLSYVDRAQSRPEDIERFLTARDRYSAISAEDLLETARLYLAPEEAVEFRAIPAEQ